MHPSKETLYAAFAAKDTRFDGRFFVGISSTGIYCRPVCRARQPRIENCTFYGSAAEAELSGLRPCLLCRPELAPGLSDVDASSTLAHRAAQLIEETSSDGGSIAGLAEALGYTDRHLRRVFTAELGVSPVQYLQTCRLLLAKTLLTDTDLSVLEVAFASGFGSLRRFNDAFKGRYRLSPSELRKSALRERRSTDAIVVYLGYRPPYRWNEVLAFLAARAITGVEVVSDATYARTIRIAGRDGKVVTGWIRVGNAPEKNALIVNLSPSLLPALSQVLSRVKQFFDLHCNPVKVYEALKDLDEIRPGSRQLGTRIPGCFDPFEVAVRAVLGQQITVKAASTLACRITKAYGQPVPTDVEGLTHVFPSAEEVLGLNDIQDSLGQLGVTSARSATIAALATGIVNHTINLTHPADPEQELAKLLRIRGIGPWTAGYLAMRAMSWPDVFLATDAAIAKTLAPRSSKETLALAERWRPWRSYATMNLWNSLNPETATRTN